MLGILKKLLLGISYKFWKSLFLNIIRIKRMAHNTIVNNGKIVFKCSVLVKGFNNQIVFGKKGYLHKCQIHCCGNNNLIEIRDEVSAEKLTIWIEDDNNKVIIGKKTSICGETQLACIEGTEIVIGEDCLFSSKIVFRTGDSHVIMDENGRRTNYSKGIKIGDHCWIGHDVKINKGVIVGDNNVIGTGSIVVKNQLDDNCIIAGVPGKVVKRNINWDRYR